MAAVSALARDHVGVALSGDGGDELFAGYDRHVWANGTWRTLAEKPQWWRKAAGLAGNIMPGLLNALLSAHNRPSSGAAGIQYMAEMLRAENTDAWYERLVAIGENPSVKPAGSPVAWFKDAADVSDDPLVRLRYLDFVQYLSDDILVKLDRASMAFGLEAREPMLDHRLVEFAFQLPSSLLIENGRGKRILRDYVHRHIPESLMNRQKKGFSVPLNDWLRGPLKAFCEDHLLGSSQDERRATDIAARWHAHQTKTANHGPSLWADVVLEAWLRRWRV
jgi:asparagine synthase (glutamine-hydrolysing)